MTDIPLLIVALVVFCGLWAYLFNLDGRVKRLKEEMREDNDTGAWPPQPKGTEKETGH